jgi:predicted Zn finger-like uncharacterized protein
MKASCPICASGFPIPDDKIAGRVRGLPVRCTKCGAIFRAYEGLRESTVQSEPTQAPWTEGHRGPLPDGPRVKKPSMHQLDPTARETNSRRKIVRSTFIDQPIPALDDRSEPLAVPANAPTEPENDGSLPEIEPQTAASAPPPATDETAEPLREAEPERAAPAKPSALDAPLPTRPAPFDPASLLVDTPEPEPEPEPAEPAQQTELELQPAAKPEPLAPPEAAPKEKPASKKRSKKRKAKPKPIAAPIVEPPAEPEPVPDPEPGPKNLQYPWEGEQSLEETVIEDMMAGPAPERPGRRAPDYFVDDEHDQRAPFADEDIHSDEFLRVKRFGEVPKTVQWVVIGLVSLVVLGMAFFFIQTNRDAGDNAKLTSQRNEAAALEQERNRQKIDFVGHFQKAERLVMLGSEDAYRGASSLLSDALRVRSDFWQAAALRAEVLGLLAAQYASAGADVQSCALAEEALRGGPDQAAALRAKAACELAGTKTGEAQKTLTAALEVPGSDPAQDANTHYLLAIVHLKGGSAKLAGEALDLSIKENPLSFRALHDRAAMYADLSQFKQAIDAEKRALALLSEANADHGPSLQTAKLRLTNWATKLPVDVAGITGADEKKAASKKIMEQLKTARGGEVMKLLNNLIALGDKAGYAHFRKCQIFLQSGNYDQAVASCEAARRYSPEAYYFLGAAFEALGNMSMRRQYYESYLNAAPGGRHASEVRSILGQGN